VQVTLHADGQTSNGGSALLMHNERLADPLDPYTQALATLTGKRKKALADHEEIGYVEFLGGLYTDPPLDEYPPNGDAKVRPCIPAWNILRCLQGGAVRHKRGQDVLRGVYPLAENVPLIYEGPKDPEKLWKAGGFSLRKSVGVQRNRTMRTRPLFMDWQVALEVEVDTTVFDQHILSKAWHDAGIYVGLGDMRPIYGRFTATVEVKS
jgi:hypothetical protein